MSSSPIWLPPVDRLAGRDFTARQLEVLDGLETIVLIEGFRDLTVGGLAERLRCSRRTLYELADSKEELVLIVIDRLLRRLARVAHEAARLETTELERLRSFLIKGLTELHRATLSFSEDVEADPAAAELVESHFRYANEIVVRMLDEGVKSGEFAPIHTRVAAEALMAGMAVLQRPSVLRQAGVTVAEAFEEFFLILTDGLRSVPNRP